ncbi:MAG: hypothetical protein HRU49_13955, partial [Winogradskyella sp.]|nr:hypothetical protein [Winogradskyella sp.]
MLELDDPTFSLNPTCDGATANITGDLGGTFTLNPDLGDGAVIDPATGTITNGISGTTYTVNYTTGGACPQTSTETVTVNLSDDASFSVTATCDGATVDLPLATPGGTFSFDVLPADAAVIDPISGEVMDGTPGATYSIVYSTSGICSDTEVVTFSVLPEDDASFSVDPTCDGGIPNPSGVLGGTFTFNIPPTDAAVIDANTGVVSNGTPGETYTIEYVTNGACPNSSIVEFTANPLPSLVAPTPLEVCDDGTPDGLTSIDLSIKDFEITGNNPQYSVSYYLSQADADDEVNPLAIPYTNISNPQTIFVRGEDEITGCFTTTTLDLVVEQAPVANMPMPLRYCDPDNDGFGVFTLTDADNEITGGAAGLTVTYHETFANADNNADAIDTSVPYTNIVADDGDSDPPIIIYARVESSTIATNCATIVPLELIVEPTPQLIAP